VAPAGGPMAGLSWAGLATSRGPGRPRRRRGTEDTGSRWSAGAMALPRPSLPRPWASRPGAYRRSSAAGSPLPAPRPLHRGTRRPARPGRQLWRPHLHRGHHRSSLTAHRAPKACHSPAQTAGQTLSQGSPPAVRTQANGSSPPTDPAPGSRACGPAVRPAACSPTDCVCWDRTIRSIRHPRRGSPIDITDPASPQRAEQQLREGGTYFDFTWALVLNELPDRGRDCWCAPGPTTHRAPLGSSPCRWACSTPPTEWRSCGRSPGVRKPRS
jgi:hypothetical protein